MVKVDTKSKSTSITSTIPLNTPQRIRNAWEKIKLRKPKRIVLRFCCCCCCCCKEEEEEEVEEDDITVELKNCTLVIKTFTKLKEMQSFINQLSSESGSTSSSSVYNTLTVMFIYNNNNNNSDNSKDLMSWFKYCYFYLLEKKLSSFSFPMIVVVDSGVVDCSQEEIVKSFVYEYDLVYENLLLNGLYIWNGPLIDSSNGREKIVVGNVLVSASSSSSSSSSDKDKDKDVPFQNCVNVFYTSTSKKGGGGGGGGFKVMEIVKNITNTEEKELFKEYMKDKEGERWNVEFRGELGLTASDGGLLLLLGRLRVPLVKLEVEDDQEEEEDLGEEEEEDVLYFLLELKEQQQKVLLFDMKLLKLQQQQHSKSNSPYDLLCGLSSGMLARVHEKSLDFDMESMLREYTDATEQNIKEITGYYKQKEEDVEEELFSEKGEEVIEEEEEKEEEPAGLVENVKEEENVFMMEEAKETVAPAINTKPKRISNLKLAKMRRQKAMKE